MVQKRYRTEALEAIARRTLLMLDPFYLNARPQVVPLEQLIEKKYGLCIEYRYLTNNGRILGKTIFDDGYTSYYDIDNHQYELMKVEKGTMFIDYTLIDPDMEGRLRFTEAHELAHWIIHQEVYAGTGEAAALMSSDQDTAAEWQANMLATCILMPLGQVKRCYYELQATGIAKRSVTEKMAQIFGVSKKAMAIRLESKGLV